MSKAPLLRRSRFDLIAAGTILAVAIVGLGIVWITAPIRHAELTPAAETFSPGAPLVQAPTTLDVLWEAPIQQVPGVQRPLSISGLVIQPEGSDVHAIDPATGNRVWSYHRDHDQLCSLAVAFESVIATYRTAIGCGDAVAINANTGTYKATRSAINSTDVVPITSNNSVGTVSHDRLELWRSDLVRTIEYGHVDAPQEPEQQPHPTCAINSALTRTELLALINQCPDTNTSELHFLATNPDDSRQPKIDHTVELARDAELVAVGQKAAAVYLPASSPGSEGMARLRSYNSSGKELSTVSVAPSPLIDATASTGGVFAAATADLPHHMSWFDGQRLYLFEPDTLAMSVAFDDALGTGVAVGGQLLFPTRAGIAVADWTTGKVNYTIPVDREGYSGPISLNQAGAALVEQRGDKFVALG